MYPVKLNQENASPTHYALDATMGLAEVIFTSEGHAYLHLPGLIVTESASGTRRYLLSDGLGSVRQVTDEAGEVVSTHEFDPYGVPLTEPAGDPYGYTGEWWQADIGLLHLRARWYDPGSGTFLSRDPSELEKNLYQYANSNPINFVDPSGLQYRSKIEGIIVEHYRDNFAVSPAKLLFEVFLPQGSKQGLSLNTSGDIPYLEGIPNLKPGFIDLIDPLPGGDIGLAYEIKPIIKSVRAAAEINWYIARWNNSELMKDIDQPDILVHGINYPVGWQVVGINPFSHNSQVIVARQASPGVIVWRGYRFRDLPPPLVIPEYVYEWNEQTKKAQRRRMMPMRPGPIPVPVCTVDPETVEQVGWTTIIAGGGYLMWNLKGCVFGPGGCLLDLATPGI